VLIRCVQQLTDLEPYRFEWDAIAGQCVFRSWTWLTAWWRHYGAANPKPELRIYLALNQQPGRADELVAALPCYLDSTWSQGRALRLLGDGEACSDHLGLLAREQAAGDAAGAIARQIVDDDDWDLIELAAIDRHDAPTEALASALAGLGCTTDLAPADRCWVIDLPTSWEEFLALQSKSHRKQLRQLERRVLVSDRARWQRVATPAEFSGAWSSLVDLHQRRRTALGEPGCFASRRWAAFHWEVAQQLLAQDRLRLSLLTLDGTPIAAEYHLAGPRITYAYQGGLDPERLGDEPGQLSMICSIQQAIAEGHRQFDLLRGDEPYKAHWRARPQESVRLLALPERLWPQIRRRAWNGARGLARATRQVAGLFN
jgi:CelD/BcsL family acetyltransferase involved in cellulose biosynthesis